MYCKNKKNLFICMTPFQIYLATKVIESERIENVLILLINLSSGDKNIFYLYKAAKEIGCDILIYQQNQSRKLLKLLFFLNFIMAHLFFVNFKNVYISSLHDRYVQILLSFIRFNGLYSFDDGVANINKDGIYFKDEFIKKKIINKIKLHFTVFPGVDNIVEDKRLRDLNVFEKHVSEYCVENKVSIFIGQPYNEIFNDFSESKISDILESLEIEYYFKHPRENYSFKKVKYIESCEIFESYLENFLKNNPKTHVEIYSFFSTVMFNVSNFSNVSLYALVNKELYLKYEYIYNLMPEFNIVTLEVK